MALPTPSTTYSFQINQRITFVSLNDTSARLMFGVKAKLKTNGYTVKGSCDGTTGAMDGVDRWSTSANAATRGAAAGNAQSWVVLTDANGVNVLVAYQGASDDVFRVSFSPGGLFVAAGSPNQQPTATDEQVICSATSMVNNTASADRVWNCIVRSDNRGFRVNVARQGSWVGLVWGVEQVTSTVVTATFNPPVWGFAFTPANLAGTSFNAAFSVNARGGLARTVVASTPFSCQCVAGYEVWAASVALFGNTQPELQGSVGYLIQPVSIATTTSGAQGKVGNLVDWWVGRLSGAADGDVYGSNQFVVVGSAGGAVWAWDGLTTPVLT